MNNYKTPGVYVEEKSASSVSVAGVSTAVPAFIGYTEKAGVNEDLVKRPTKIQTIKEYEELFGFAPEEKIEINVDNNDTIISCNVPALAKRMYYSMQMFFDNGGDSCYIVSLGSAIGNAAGFDAALDTLKLEDEPTLIVIPDSATIAGMDITPVDVDMYYNLCQKALMQCGKMKDRFAVIDVLETGGSTDDDAAKIRNDIGQENLKYGAAYYPYIKTPLKYNYSDDSVVVINADAVAAAVAVAEEVAADVNSDADDIEAANAAVALAAAGCKLGDDTIKVEKTELYFNIIKEIESNTITLPPSATIAGKYASVDRDRGVWKAPANVSLVSVIEPSKKLTESENDSLNIDATSGKSINAIRNFTGKGTLIWGARTLAGNDNDWRYVPVRRLFNYIEESVKKATSFAVFEPNTAMTWLKLRSMVEGFLDSLWRQGALAGGKAEDAYFVQAGLGTTMTSQDIQEGRLIVKIGLAAARPAEFIVLEFTHKIQE
ncbi:MAG: phage tail sheath family protein [Desulfobacterales bacterium]|nr:phage tail sheath family protein [Desulfobacterales bacterium]